MSLNKTTSYIVKCDQTGWPIDDLTVTQSGLPPYHWTEKPEKKLILVFVTVDKREQALPRATELAKKFYGLEE